VRILLIGDYPRDPQLGSAKVFLKLQSELRELGHTCDLLLADDLGARPHNPYMRQAFGPVAAFACVRRIVRERGPYDVIDAASAEGLWIGLARRRGLFSGTALVARSNGLEHLNYKRMLDDHDAGLLHKPWTRRLFHPAVRLTQVAMSARVADRLLLLNEVDRDFAVNRRWKPAEAIDVVPHGVSSEFLAEPDGQNPARGAGLLFCGSWTDVKGVSYLASAFSMLIQDGCATPLTVLGGGVPRETILSAFSEVARRHVTVIDRMPEPEVMAAYRTHDVLVWPSTYEGFGMVVVEAMSQRLPVIATPVGCARALIAHDKTGLIVEPRRPDLLAAAMKRMVGDSQLRWRLAEAAFDRVKDMSWRCTANKTVDSYERAMKSHASAA
jgi:glycosyltransferase involved in cell wall biosynthesis